MRRYYLQSGLWMSVLTVLTFGGLYVAADLNATTNSSNTLNIEGDSGVIPIFTLDLDKISPRSTKIVVQNSFSLSLDANSAAGDQAVTSVNTSADQDVSIQVFGSSIQNAIGFGLHFEYDASQVTYQGFDEGSVLPGSPQVLAEHGTNPTSVTVGIASFGSQATVSSGLVGTIRFRTTTGFSGTAVQLVRADLSRGGQSETVTLSARVELQVSTAPCPDFDGDGTVGIPDFLQFVNHFGTSRGDGTYQAKYDLDGNGAIGIPDFLSFVDNFGKEVDCSSSGGGIGSPDLIVTSPSVSNNTLTTGQSFTLSATVRNQGTGSSASTTLRYYRSSNATISTSDTEIGKDSVSGLSASGTSAESVSLNAPSSAGTYYYGACVESVSGESDTNNNCSDGMSVTVSALTSSSELSIAPGETKGYSKTFSASFSFNSLVESLAYRVRSSTVDDGLSGLSESDVKVSWKGSRNNLTFETSVNSITFSYDIHVSSTVPSNTTLRATIVYDVGTHNPRMDFVDTFRTKETYTLSLMILVRNSGGSSSGGGSSSPDLIVESPSVSNNTLTTGQSFTLSATVRNQGTGSSASTTLSYYRSSNATISTSDTEVGTDSVSGLSASGTSAESISLNAPSSAGTYYYGACVESVSGESDTNNNCSDGVSVTVSSSSGGGGGGGSGGSLGACRAGLVVNPSESCTYKDFTFSVSSSGRGSIAFFSAGTGLNLTGTINGVQWNFVASKNSDSNSWTIHTAN